MKSLRTKFLVLVLTPVLLIFIVVGTFVIKKFYDSQVQNTIENTETLTANFAGEIERELNNAFKLVDNVAKMVEGQLKQRTGERSNMVTVLRSILENNEAYHGLWLGFEPNAFDGEDLIYRSSADHDHTGRFIPHFYWEDGQVKQAYLMDYDDEELGAYYQLALHSGKAQILEPFSYEIGGKDVAMTTIAIPIKLDNRVVGVAGIDLSTEYLGEITSHLKVFENGFGRLMTEKGFMVYHPQSERIGAVGEEFQTDAGAEILRRAQEKQISDWNYAPALKTMSFKTYYPIRIGDIHDRWILGAVVQQNEMYAEIKVVVAQMLLMIIIGLILLVFAIVVVSGTITKPIARINSFLGKIGNLDLRVENQDIVQPLLNRKDEFGLIAKALETMQHSLIEVSTEMIKISNEMARGSGEIAASVGQNSAAIEQVTTSMGELGNGVARTRDDSITMTDDASKVETLATDGLMQMKDTLSSMEQIVSLAKGSQESLNVLSSQVATMESVLNMIGDVAEQTNLLALNAAIEAARAGEQGRGFAVVADEVRTLAEQTQESVREITQMVGNLVNYATDSTKQMEDTEKQINMGSSLLTQTETTFIQIAHYIDGVAGAIQDFSASLNDMNEMSTSVSAATQEQAASMGEIALNTDRLAGLGKELQEIATRFTL